jgi:hypothetical protein
MIVSILRQRSIKHISGIYLTLAIEGDTRAN